jgi:hypothetical protein
MLSKQIRAHKKNYPNASAKEIAHTVGTSPAYVYQVLAPKKSKKAKKDLKPVAPTEGQEIVREEVKRLHVEIEKLQILQEMDAELIADIRDELDRLNHDIVGYRAVISYLQGQLDGATV